MKKINEIVRQKRKELNLSIEKLSKKTGIRTATISEFETGKRSIGSKLLNKILTELELDIK